MQIGSFTLDLLFLRPYHRGAPSRGTCLPRCSARPSRGGLYPSPTRIMGRDHSFTDDFPSITINGRRYRYGRENMYGQYLVENADPMCAKDYWCFDKREDLLAFLVNLPESADHEAFVASHPDWHEVSDEQRELFMQERDAKLRQLTEEKQEAGTAEHFNVVQFDDEGSGWYCAYAGTGRWDYCDDVDIQVHEYEDPCKHTKELVIDIRTSPTFGKEQRTITVWRRQALKLASALIKAAGYVEDRLSGPLPDDKQL